MPIQPETASYQQLSETSAPLLLVSQPLAKNSKQVLSHPLDVILISGDAYVDHPSFGTAVIARWLQAHGYSVGIIDQPDVNNPESFTCFGKPRLFFGISAGNVDSIVSHYTAQRKLRHDDPYSPNGMAGKRPDLATIVYSQMIRRTYKQSTIVLGGIEASLRRIPHFDFYSGKIRNSILFDSRAEILVYGMGERAIVEIARRKSKGTSLNGIRGTVVSVSEKPESCIELPDWQTARQPDGFYLLTREFHAHFRENNLSQPFAGRFLLHYPPAEPLSRREMDKLYLMPFSRKPAPKYKGMSIPAWEQIRKSITAHRGCFGGCHFCAIGLHQGKTIQSRSINSILYEMGQIQSVAGSNTQISDIGG
ncbi:MAG: hypothetical protein K8S56_09590, partial [Candidatus Cloacimonetes bacterium]|nr:hypothetical protein [Candidatus Cloacimonadota bacterium]